MGAILQTLRSTMGLSLESATNFPTANKLDYYEDSVSGQLNICLRHRTGREMNNPNLGLKCDAAWVSIYL